MEGWNARRRTSIRFLDRMTPFLTGTFRMLGLPAFWSAFEDTGSLVAQPDNSAFQKAPHGFAFLSTRQGTRKKQHLVGLGDNMKIRPQYRRHLTPSLRFLTISTITGAVAGERGHLLQVRSRKLPLHGDCDRPHVVAEVSRPR